MYTAAALQDMHRRAHSGLRKLLGRCAELTDEELQRRLPGFGFPSIMIQLVHMIGGEAYWQLVITKGYDEGGAGAALRRSGGGGGLPRADARLPRPTCGAPARAS